MACDNCKNRYINTNKYSGCSIDHAPCRFCKPNARQAYLDLTKAIADQFGHGRPVDTGELSDEDIEAIRNRCVQIRKMDN